MTVLDEAQDYSEYLTFAEGLARQAADIFRTGFEQSTSNVQLKGAVDLVTDTDHSIENYIINSIKTRYPDHLIVAEESVAAGDMNKEITDVQTWIVDPVDGTTNFVHRLCMTCISIGLAIKKQVVVGVVFNPIMNELFTAVRGQGARLNGKLLHVSSTDNLKSALVATGFPYNRSDQLIDHILLNCKVVLKNCRDIRRLGSAALDMCYVARGIFDLYYETGVQPWDVAAASLIVEEAGGHVMDMYDSAFHLGLGRIACGNPGLVKKLNQVLVRPQD
ncbi:uncharacterized protein LOC126324494 [Schistocerca gregaria]|uniref:uncharacterized protein LOC126324494 n=1 Tax=Schistocerca gregaria TaxID=7010 RepID=UPI00211DC77C|nr:uncharacterized protein LOC126324494 [Schistocerca gregaria]